MPLAARAASLGKIESWFACVCVLAIKLIAPSEGATKEILRCAKGGNGNRKGNGNSELVEKME